MYVFWLNLKQKKVDRNRSAKLPQQNSERVINKDAIQVDMMISTGKGLAAFLAVALLAAVLVAAGCLSAESSRVIIVPENSYWSPAMSSVIGIGLSADYSGSGNVTYKWTADYGGFLLWTPEVVPCGSPCTGTDTVWWTYVTEDSIPSVSDLPGEVRITVDAIDQGTGDTLAESAVMLERDENGGYSISLNG